MATLQEGDQMDLMLKEFTEIEKLGQGGMGEVFAATQVSHKRRVALKKMSLSKFSDRNHIEQFWNGARLAATLHHDNIIHVYNFGQENDALYFAMEYIDGSDLEKLLAVEPFPWEIGIMIALEALKGLNYAHKKGIVHGDFKPNNILVSKSGMVKIADFGLAHLRTQSSYFSKEDTRFITPSYMAPEVARLFTEIELSHDAFLDTTPITIKSTPIINRNNLEGTDISRDIWAAGVLLYRIFCGQLPFSGETFSDLAQSIINSKEPIFFNFMPFLPDDCVTAINACLAKEPQNRPASLDALIKSLEFLISEIGFLDIEKEIRLYMADNNSSAHNREKVLLNYHTRMADTCRELGDTFKAAAHFNESEKLNGNEDAANQLDFIVPSEQPEKIQAPILILNDNKTPNKWKKFLTVSWGIKIAFAASAIIIVYIAVGAFFTMLQKNRTGGETKIEAPQTKPMIAVPNTAAPNNTAAVAAVQPAQPTQTVQPVQQPTQGFAVKGSRPAQPSAGKSTRLASNRNKIPGKPIGQTEQKKSAILKVNIKPLNAVVLLDGNDFPPQDLTTGKSVAPGKHVITAEMPGFEPFQNTYAIEPGVTQVLDISLRQAEKGTGFLHVYSYPWSELYVDGVLQGTTPTPKPLTFLEGDHAVLLKREGYKPYSQTIRLLKGQVMHVQAQLEKLELSGR